MSSENNNEQNHSRKNHIPSDWIRHFVTSLKTIRVRIFNSLFGSSIKGTLFEDTVHLRITVGRSILTASLIKSKTTDDFLNLLPLNITMNDLFKREKYGPLPKSLSTDALSTHSYQVGDIGYWPPCNDLAIYYHHDGETIPGPGIIILGKIRSNLRALKNRDLVQVRIELGTTV